MNLNSDYQEENLNLHECECDGAFGEDGESLGENVDNLCLGYSYDEIIEELAGVIDREIKSADFGRSTAEERIIRDGLNKILENLEKYRECPSRWQELETMPSDVSEDQKRGAEELGKYLRIMRERNGYVPKARPAIPLARYIAEQEDTAEEPEGAC